MRLPFSAPCLIGLDVGTTAVKAGLFDLHGRLLAAARQAYTLATPAPKQVELDAEIYWQACRAAVHAVVRLGGAQPAAVVGLCVASQGETLIPVDAAGQATRPALVWLDNRAEAEAREIAGYFDPVELYRVTGQPSVTPTWPASKLLWLRRHEPAVYERSAHFLLVADFIVQRLTGEWVTDWSLQSSSLMFDIRRRAWWAPMLDVVGIRPDQLARLVPPGRVIGPLTRAGAQALGLKTSTVVVSGGLDQVVGAVGSGNVAVGGVTEATGGALAIVATLASPVYDPQRRLPLHLHAAPEVYCLLPWGQTAGMALQWFRDQFCAGELAQAAPAGQDGFALMTAAAAAVPPGADGLLVLPHLEGAAAPEFNPAARAVFFGATLRHTRAHFVRALLESVAYMLRTNRDLLVTLGSHVPAICSIGGGARSPLWLQIKADVLQTPVTTVAVEEVTCLGAAMLAAVALGGYAHLAEAAAQMVTVNATIDPRPELAGVYDHGFARYTELYERLVPMFNPDFPSLST